MDTRFWGIARMRLLSAALVLAVGFGSSQLLASGSANDLLLESEQLGRGAVLVALEDRQRVKFMVARVLIDEPPERVWPILTNPFEFERKISPRMKSVEVVLDQPGKSVLKCTVDVCFILPCLTYIVESTYSPLERIDYKRVGGAIKDFRGEWRITPACQGRKSEVSYSMYIEPGFPVPQWIVRQGVKVELPRTLRALRKRVHAVYRLSQLPERRTILASGSHLNAG